MTHPLRIALTLATAVLATACTTDDQELLRRPIDKADLAGSCSGFCGGPSDGNCWCDDLCTRIGDCCGDVGQVCSIGVDGGAAPELDCTNGLDDDADGLIDCADPSCQFPEGPCGTPDAGVLDGGPGVPDGGAAVLDAGAATADGGAVSPIDAGPGPGVPDAAP